MLRHTFFIKPSAEFELYEADLIQSAYLNAHQKRLRGFTLVEVLVAMSILAVVLVAANRAALLSISHSQEIKQRVLADLVAQNRLHGHLAADDWLLGTFRGKSQQADMQFVWQEVITQTPNPAFRKVVVTVYDPVDRQHELRTLVGFMINPSYQYAR